MTYADLVRAAHSACFHYWNCMNDCNEARRSMAELARVSGYSDPAVDDEIADALKDEEG